MLFGFHSKLLLTTVVLIGIMSCHTYRTELLFDGQTFNGWEGDTITTWQIVDGAIVGGSLTDTVPHNDFVVTTESYNNFILKLKFKLEGSEGFINAGVQFRSRRLREPAYEMIGYQADIGDKLWGALYDESRRKTVLSRPDTLVNKPTVNLQGWNDYEIHAEGNRIRLFLNGTQTVDYTEPDTTIIQKGKIGLQIHGNGKARVAYKDIFIQELD